MVFPAEVQEILDIATTEVDNDLQHRLSPFTRSRIYKTLRMVYGSSVPNLLFGHLGYLTSQKVRNYWDDAMPLWPDDEDEPEPKTRHLTSYFLKLLQQVLDGSADLDFVTQELGTYWYAVSNIGDEIFEWRNTDAELAAAYYALEAVYLALSETFHQTSLETRVKKLEGKTDEMLRSYQLDCAGAAVLAIVGAGKYEKNPTTSSQNRLAFWNWWLMEALPQAQEAVR